MMKDNKLLYFLLLGIGVSVSIYLFSLRDAERYDLNFLKDKELILKKRIKSLTAQRREIMDFSNIYNFSDSAYSSLVARIEKGSSLVLLIPENPCLDCIMKEYDKLKELPNSIQDDIILLTNFKRIRDLKIFLNQNKLDYPAYNSSFPVLNELKDSKNPIFLILDSSYIPQHIFVPVSFMPELTDEYIEFIISDIFKIEQQSNRVLAEINIKKNKYDFGELKLEEKVETRFEIQNISDTPLIITDVKSDCGCTVVDWGKKPTANGGKALIRVQFKAEKIGFFVKKIIVFSNASNSPHALIIKGEVKN